MYNETAGSVIYSINIGLMFVIKRDIYYMTTLVIDIETKYTIYYSVYITVPSTS